MRRLVLILAVLALPACAKGKGPYVPIPTGTPDHAGPWVVLEETQIAVSHFTKDEPRRYLTTRLREIADGSGYLLTWNRPRFIHIYATMSVKSFDVAFLDGDGKAVDLQELPGSSEVGITARVVAKHALVLPKGWCEAHHVALGDAAKVSPEIADAAIEPMPVIKVGGVDIHVETSPTNDQRERGLMHRPRMVPDEGMLFIYSGEREHSFWMRNTLVPLDISYFDAKGQLVKVCRMQMYPNPAEDSSPNAPSEKPVQFVLEVNLGWYDAHKLIDKDGYPIQPVTLEIPESVRKQVTTSDP